MPDPLMTGALLDGRYELQSTLGRGGMATVYRAWDRIGQRPCAVKVLSDVLSGDEQFRRRFRQEATAAQSLAHPSIVRVDDWGEAGSHPYIVMEYVAGGTLRDLLRRRGLLPPALAVRIAAEVAEALAHAHARGVVHRDIKPENLLLAENGHIKVADFGIARTVDAAALTRTGIVMGSARYLSPEQARGRPGGPRSDLYALGVILFEMLAGRVPFDGDSAVAIAVQHVHEPPPGLQQLRPDVPAAVAASVERLLAKQEEDRYSNAAVLAGDLRRQGALLPGGLEDGSFRFEADDRGPSTAVETAPVDLGAQPPPAISRTAPLEAAAATIGATAALPAAGVTGIASPGAARAAPLGSAMIEPPSDARVGSSGATHIGPRGGSDLDAPGAAHVRPRDGTPAVGHRRGFGSTALVTVLLLALAVIIRAHGFRLGQPPVIVPTLLGQSVAAASDAVRTLGLRIVVADRRQDARTPAGLITAQDPPPGPLVGKEAVVRVVVSQGSGTVPDLRGLPLDDAARLVQEAGLRLRRVVDISGLGNGGEGGRSTIMWQLQAPGTHLAPDGVVDVVLGPRVEKAPSPGGPGVTPGQQKDGGRERD